MNNKNNNKIDYFKINVLKVKCRKLRKTDPKKVNSTLSNYPDPQVLAKMF